MTGRCALATEHREQWQSEGCDFQQTVTLFTRIENVHLLLPMRNGFVQRPARVKTAALNLIGVIYASSFDAHTHTVNALTEELVHIRFSVHAVPDRAAIELRI